MKKERNKFFRQIHYYSILPWLIWGVGGVSGVVISLIFGLDWKGVILGWLNVATFFLIVTFCWGIYWMLKIKKCLRKLDKIDEKIEKERANSNF